MGKPGWPKGQSLRTEYIGAVEQTRGTETSQYPEEKTSIETPSVAASERGRAQTTGVPRVHPLLLWGCGAVFRHVCIRGQVVHDVSKT